MCSKFWDGLWIVRHWFWYCKLREQVRACMSSMLSKTTHLLAVLATLLLKGTESWKIEGTSFWLMLPGDGGEDVETTISVAGDEGTTVTLTATEPALLLTDSIDASGVLNMSLGPDHHVDILSEGDSQKAIHVVSNNSVAVNVLTKGKTIALSYTADPQLVGGYFSHRVVTHCPENDTCNSVIAIVGIMNSPQIMVTVRSSTVVTINGVDYTNGDVIPVYIFQYEITLLRCKGDISGSQVFTPFPTNVFSGSYCDKGGTFGCDFTFEQIPPKRLLGSQFTIGPFPPSVNGFYRIVASTSNTAIVKDDSSTLTVINEGEFYDIKDILQISKIESSSPVLLTMLIIDGTSQDSHSNAMIVIQPSTENRKYYRVISPEGYRSYTQMEAPRGLHRNVWINNQLVCSQDIYIEQLNVTLLFVQLKQGIGNVACSDDHPTYGLVTYGFRNNLAYGYSALPGKPIKSPEGNSGACPSSSPDLMDLSTISFSSDEFVQESTLGSTTMPQDSSTYRSISQDKRPTADAHSETLAQESHYSVIQGLVTSRTFAGPSSTLTTDTPEQRPHSSVTSTTQNYPGDTLILTSADTEMNTFQGPPTMIMPSTSGIDVVITGMDTFQTYSESTRIINVLTTMLLPTLMLDTSAILSFDRLLPPTSMHGSVLPNSDSVQGVSATATDIVTSYPSTIAHVSLLCSCPCWRQTLQGTKADILKQLDSILEEVRKNLTLDKDTLSATIRKRISAPDARKSATGVGAIGTGVVTFFFSLVVFGDIVSFVLGCVRWFGKTVNIKVGVAS